MDMAMHDRHAYPLVRRRIPNNVERGRQMASTSFNIRDNKINVELVVVEAKFKLFKLIQHRFNFDSTCFNTVKRGSRRFQHGFSTKSNGC